MTRKKTINVFENLNSLPTCIGPPLIEKADFTIGILIPNMENPFYVEIAKNIQQRGHELGFRVVNNRAHCLTTENYFPKFDEASCNEINRMDLKEY